MAAAVRLFCALAVSLASVTVLAAPQRPGAPPAPTSFVTDDRGFLSPGTRAALEAALGRHQDASGQQVILWIGQPASAEVIDEWAARTFAAWGIGRKGRDDGVAIFILPEQRKVRIEVGYGLEAILPDVRAAQIIRDEMLPRLERGDRDGAARAGVTRVLAALGDKHGIAGDQPAQPDGDRGLGDLSWFELVLLGLAALAALAFVVTHPRLALHLLWLLASSAARGAGRHGGSGGRFSGGGGRSGGGGASGSW